MVKPRTQADYDAVRRGHNRSNKLELWTPAGYVADLPISGGELAWSLTAANGMRSGRLMVPGYEWFEKCDPGLATWIEATVYIEGSAFGFGQFPVLRSVITRPGGTVELSLGDWSYRRAQPQAEAAVTVGATNQTLAESIRQWMGGVLPPITITRNDTITGSLPDGVNCITPLEVNFGGNIWQALYKICEQQGCTPVMTSRATCEIRNYIAGATTENIDGTVEKESVAILADEAVNRIVAKAESSDYQKGDYYATKTLTTGPYAYSAQNFGATAIVISERTPVATQGMANALAARTYERRAGLVRSQSVETVPMPWLEAGDTVEWNPSFLSYPLSGRIESMTFPLTAEGSQRMTLRDSVIR